MAFTDRTSHELALALEIEGVPYIFVERAVTASLFQDERSQNRTQLEVLLPDAVNTGTTKLNPETRAEEGATISAKLRDDAAETLLTLFASRRREDTYLDADIDEADAMTGSGTIVVGSTSAAGGSYVYIGRETFYFSGTTSTNLQNAYRGMFGSPAQSHFGGESIGDGAGVWFDGPPSWRGREVTLYGVFLEDDELVTIAKGRLKGAPQPGPGNEWTIQASSLSNWYRERPIYTGIPGPVRPAEGEAEFLLAGGLTVPEQAAEFFVTGSTPTYALVKVSGFERRALFRIRSVTGRVLSLESTDWLDPSWAEGFVPDAGGVSYESVQHVGIVSGAPWAVALRVLLSRLGDATQGIFDSLPGVARASIDGDSWRMGAGLTTSQVDATSARKNLTGPVLTYALTRQTTVGDFLRQVCEAAGAYWYVNASGAIAFGRLRQRVPVSEAAESITVTDARLHPRTVEALDVDETAIASVVTMRANYDPLQERHLAEVNSVDVDLLRLFPESAQRKEYESELLTVDSPNLSPGVQRFVRRGAVTQDQIRRRLRREQQNSARPRVTFPGVLVGADALEVRPGQIVNVTNERLPDLEGARLSSATPHLVRGRGPLIKSTDGLVNLDLERLERGWLVAPVGVVASWDGGTKTITLDTAAGSIGRAIGGTNPGDDFAANWSLKLFDVSAETSEDAVAASVTSTTIVLVGTPTFTPVAGDLVTIVNDIQGACVTGYEPDDAMYQVGDDGTLDTGAGTRWS